VVTADDYVNKVLAMMPETLPQRAQIAAELRSHIAERLAHGHPLDDVLQQLGDPAKLADSYLSAEPLVSAPFGARVVAKIVDAVGVLAVMCPTAWLVAQLVPYYWRPVVMICIVFIGSSLVFGIYTMTSEYRRGQTIGKRLRGIRVVSESGARISVGQAIVRQLPMFLQVYWIDAMFALFTDKSQRAFEMLSKTRVVRAT
jgi:uncharacterized RDD family membrane protein YckC